MAGMTTRRGARSLAAVAVIASLALSACGSDADSGDGDEDEKAFALVAALSTSGALATFGAQGKAAFETGIKIVNEQGGIDGRQVELTVIDTASDPAQAVANVQAHLADHDKPDAVFAAESSGVALALAPILTQAEILNVTTANTTTLAVAEEFPLTFQLSIPPLTVNGELAEHLAAAGYRKVGFIASDNEFGHSSAEAFQTVAAEVDVQVEPGYVPDGAVDASAALERVRAASPDVLVLSGTGPVVTAMLKGRAAIGWDIPVVGEGSAFATQNLGLISEPSQWNDLTVQVPNWSVSDSSMLTTPAFERFFETFRADHEVQVAMAFPVAVYQSLLTIKAAYDEADEADAASLAATLETVGTTSIPDSIAELWVGPSALGYDATSHASNGWTFEDFTYVPGQASVDGMVASTN